MRTGGPRYSRPDDALPEHLSRFMAKIWVPEDIQWLEIRRWRGSHDSPGVSDVLSTNRTVPNASKAPKKSDSARNAKREWTGVTVSGHPPERYETDDTTVGDGEPVVAGSCNS